MTTQATVLRLASTRLDPTNWKLYIWELPSEDEDIYGETTHHLRALDYVRYPRYCILSEYQAWVLSRTFQDPDRPGAIPKWMVQFWSRNFDSEGFQVESWLTMGKTRAELPLHHAQVKQTMMQVKKPCPPTSVAKTKVEEDASTGLDGKIGQREYPIVIVDNEGDIFSRQGETVPTTEISYKRSAHKAAGDSVTDGSSSLPALDSERHKMSSTQKSLNPRKRQHNETELAEGKPKVMAEDGNVDGKKEDTKETARERRHKRAKVRNISLERRVHEMELERQEMAKNMLELETRAKKLKADLKTAKTNEKVRDRWFEPAVKTSARLLEWFQIMYREHMNAGNPRDKVVETEFKKVQEEWGEIGYKQLREMGKMFGKDLPGSYYQ